MSGFREFITLRKKNKPKADIAVNTEYNVQEPILEEEEEEEIERTANTSANSLSARAPEEIGRDVEIRNDAAGIWYGLIDTRSYRIGGVSDLFRTHFDFTGRFLPSNRQLLNLSDGEVYRTIGLLEGYSANPTVDDLLNKSTDTVEKATKPGIPSQFQKSERREKKKNKKFLHFLNLTNQLGPTRRKSPSRRQKSMDKTKLGRYSAENDEPLANSSFAFNHPSATTHSETNCTPPIKDNMNIPKVDNNVLKWYSQLIPMLEIKPNDNSATAIRTFMERCKHACVVLDEEQTRTFLFTIICRMSNDVAKKLKKFTFDSLEDLEGSLKEAYPQASNREYILEKIRNCRQKDNEKVADFISRLRELLQEGKSEDPTDPEYNKAATVAIKNGIKSDFVYMQLTNAGSDATFEDLTSKAISAEQEFGMRSRGASLPNENGNPTMDINLIEQFKRVLSVLETKAAELNTSQGGNQPQVEVNALRVQGPRPKICYNCGRPDHIRNQCRFRPNYQYPQNQYTNYMYHPQQQQPIYAMNQQQPFPPVSEPNNADRNEKCGLCGLPDHNPTNCPRNHSPGNTVTEICQLCDAAGHTAKQCGQAGNSNRSAQ